MSLGILSSLLSAVGLTGDRPDPHSNPLYADPNYTPPNGTNQYDPNNYFKPTEEHPFRQVGDPPSRPFWLMPDRPNVILSDTGSFLQDFMNSSGFGG